MNVVAWGFGCYVVVFGWWDLRRWKRKRAGRCVGCGYDAVGLGEGVVCPECGGPLGRARSGFIEEA